VGRWRLVSYTERKDSGESFDVFGPNPIGHILYTASGHMSVLFASSQRTPFAGAWSAVTDRQKAEAFDGFVAYEGRYTDHGDRVVHHLETSWISNWQGRDLERFVTHLPGGKVCLSTPSMRFGRPQPVQDVVLERVA
jgi:hypothetical protein